MMWHFIPVCALTIVAFAFGLGVGMAWGFRHGRRDALQQSNRVFLRQREAQDG